MYLKEDVRQTLKDSKLYCIFKIEDFKDIKTLQPFDSTIIVSPPSKLNHRYFFGYGDESREIEESLYIRRRRL